MKHLLFLMAAVVCAVVLGMSGCMQSKTPAAPPPIPQDVSILSVGTLPTNSEDPAWNQATEFVAKLMLQDMVEPRQMKISVPEVKIRALGNGDRVAFRLEWADATLNDVPGPAYFTDACAVQMPAILNPSLPAPQMGEVGKHVNIAYWSAVFQAMVTGREDTIKALHPNSSVDHYPFEAAALVKDSTEQKEMAKRYAPARALGNWMSGPRTNPVQDLIAAGPGTITTAEENLSKGSGKRTATGWSVVIVRELPKGFTPQSSTQVAFAIWDGAEQEVGARKMRSAWIPIAYVGVAK
jgi:hypothetical protein